MNFLLPFGSFIISCLRRVLGGLLLRLSTPFWEFQYAAAPTRADTILSATSFYSLLGVSVLHKYCSNMLISLFETFYSLLGVSMAYLITINTKPCK